MSISKADMIELLGKAQEIIDTVINELPDDNDNDDIDSPFTYLNNACGDLQDAINLLWE